MYSPKIREDLIPRLYQIAKKAGIPMTRWVNRLIETALREEDQRRAENPQPRTEGEQPWPEPFHTTTVSSSAGKTS